LFLEEYTEDTGIKVFHEDIETNHDDYNAQWLDQIFQEEERHFWFIARKEFIFNQMKKLIDSSAKIIEIGAGTGNVSRYLQQRGYSNLAVGEMHSNGLRYAKSYGIKECYQFDLLRAPFVDEFEVVCMFDVLEHIEDDHLALSNIYTILQKRGHLVLTVPSHMWLWNHDDIIAGHKRRYTRKELERKLNDAGFKVEISRYFFISIVPLLWVRKVLNRNKMKETCADNDEKSIALNALVNKVLLYITRLENRIENFLPNRFGGSLLVIASKR